MHVLHIEPYDDDNLNYYKFVVKHVYLINPEMLHRLEYPQLIIDEQVHQHIYGENEEKNEGKEKPLPSNG
jgi:hypothetical protein